MLMAFRSELSSKFKTLSSKFKVLSSKFTFFSDMSNTNGNLLDVRDLRTYFDTEDGEVKAVDGISFQLKRGETLGIVGESGSGKSVTNLSIIRLIPEPPGRIVAGQVMFDGVDILSLQEKEVRKIRGRSGAKASVRRIILMSKSRGRAIS